MSREQVDWTQRGEYIAKHGVTVAQANEAFADPEAVWFDPDPRSTSGLGIKVIGYSHTAGRVLAVLVFRSHGGFVGSTCYPATGRDRRAYTEGDGDDER